MWVLFCSSRQSPDVLYVSQLQAPTAALKSDSVDNVSAVGVGGGGCNVKPGTMTHGPCSGLSDCEAAPSTAH